MARLATLWPDGTELVTGTVVIASLMRGRHELASIQLDSIRQSFRRALEKAGCSDVPIWGYIDFSLNIHADQAYADHWCPHVTFVTLAKYEKRLKAGLKNVLEKTTVIKRPCVFKPVIDWEAQVSYVNKFRPMKRIDYDKTSPQAKPTKQWLDPDGNAEFLFYITLCSVRERDVLFGIRKHRRQLELV